MKMAAHNELGHIGEELAASMLIGEGYTILYRNWRPEKGRQEVDIIAQTGSQIVFVEVKTRTSNTFGEPEEFVSPDKVKNLLNAAKAFFLEKKDCAYLELRFDVVAFVLGFHSHKLISYRHISNAFQSDPYFY
ncbi:MAG: YraN family protein [Paludibacteraceae bacterium]|nr:YraN family protein [Paludibacteraceae bacterium]